MNRDYSDTGFVWKNDIYAHGSSVNKEGMIIRPKKCMECSGDLTAEESVFYVFAARGTQAASSRYVHITCEPKCRIAPLSRERSICRVCGKFENVDGCFVIPGRKIYYHQACLPNASKELIPEEELKAKIQKRAEGRLKRGEVYYEIKIDPYTSLDLGRQNGSHPQHGHNKVVVAVKPLDGRLVAATYNWSVHLFRSNRWTKPTDMESECAWAIAESKKENRWRKEEPVPDNIIEVLQKVKEDLQKHYDGRGHVIGERLDGDYKLRFVLNYGTSLEGAINEPVR